MHHDFLDKFSRHDSPIHRLSAPAKLTSAVLMVILTVLCPWSRYGFFIAAALLLMAVAALTRIPAAFLAKKLLLLEPIALGVAALSLLQPGGLHIFLFILIKSTICLFSMILLSGTTPFADILAVLKRVRVPAILVTTLALLYRYLFVLIDEAERMQRARECRSFDAKPTNAWRNLAAVAGQLFARSSERAERIYAAMCARGWK
jgi:cobalt/nickel transport system permease protein